MTMIANLEATTLNTLQIIFDELGWLGVLLVMVIENATGLAPSEIVLGFAGWMLIDAHGLPLCTVFWGGFIAAVGSLIGSSMLYWTARLGGRPVVDCISSVLHIDKRHIDRVERMAERWGTGFIFFGRLLPGVRTLAAIPAGLTRMSYPAFMLATFTGAYIWCTLFIGAGYVLGHEWHLIIGVIKQAAPYALVIGTLSGLGFLLNQFWRKRKMIPVKFNPE